MDLAEPYKPFIATLKFLFCSSSTTPNTHVHQQNDGASQIAFPNPINRKCMGGVYEDVFGIVTQKQKASQR